jgi:hypothetical protein
MLLTNLQRAIPFRAHFILRSAWPNAAAQTPPTNGREHKCIALVRSFCSRLLYGIVSKPLLHVPNEAGSLLWTLECTLGHNHRVSILSHDENVLAGVFDPIYLSPRSRARQIADRCSEAGRINSQRPNGRFEFDLGPQWKERCACERGYRPNDCKLPEIKMPRI